MFPIFDWPCFFRISDIEHEVSIASKLLLFMSSETGSMRIFASDISHVSLNLWQHIKEKKCNVNSDQNAHENTNKVSHLILLQFGDGTSLCEVFGGVVRSGHVDGAELNGVVP